MGRSEKRVGVKHGIVRIQSFLYKRHVVFIWRRDVFHLFPARRDTTWNRQISGIVGTKICMQTLLDEMILKINTYSVYHVIKSIQITHLKLRINHSNVIDESNVVTCFIFFSGLCVLIFFLGLCWLVFEKNY